MLSLTLPISPSELDLSYTLTSGQSFRWRRDAEGYWACLLPVARAGEDRRDVLVRIRPVPHPNPRENLTPALSLRKEREQENDSGNTAARMLSGPGAMPVALDRHADPAIASVTPGGPGAMPVALDRHADPAIASVTPGGPGAMLIALDEHADTATASAVISDYFRLNVCLSDLSAAFSAADPRLTAALTNFAGLRVLRQDPVECLFSFICTSAAPLHRIRKSVTGLCERYGDPLPGGPVAGLTHHTFPPLERLASATVPDMMTLGLGYRARYVQAASREILSNGGEGWLHALRAAPYAEAKAALLTLTGVGPKIADCVSLFCLDKDDAIPVDTHIWKVCAGRYVDIPGRSLTPSAYQQIGDALRARFGPMAGWAQQYLFYEDLYEQGAWGAYIEKVMGGAADMPVV
jgi:N-glycosylase/DNA lyase